MGSLSNGQTDRISARMSFITPVLLRDWVLNSIARKYHKIREGVNHTMGGVVLDHPAKRIYNEGAEQERIKNIRNIMDALHYSAEQAMDVLKIPASEQSKYMAML